MINSMTNKKLDYKNVISELNKFSKKDKQKIFVKFFKTGKGEYGEGDKFLGISVPVIRKIAKEYINLDLEDINALLKNEYYEIRLTALIILTYKFEKYTKEKNEKELKNIFDFYLKNTKYINNWDLVDLSCYKIVCEYLLNKDRKILYNLATSKNLWERRISIVSTFEFIKNKEHKDTTKICEILLNDKQEIIHKAIGWMLREAGKKINKNIIIDFLDKNCKKMPRIMLRYSIERLSDKEKEFYMKK